MDASTDDAPGGLGSPIAGIRRWARASKELPHEALGFLGRRQLGSRRGPPQGAVPGAMVLPEDAQRPVLRVWSYDADALEEHEDVAVAALPELVARSGRTAWIDVTGFGDRHTLERVGELLDIHPLALADVVHVPQRPKADLYGDRLLVVLQMARVADSGEIDIEQVSLVMGPGWVVTFQEREGDVFDPVRERIRASATRIRQLGPEYLLYALVDAVVDGYFDVVESLGGVIDSLEEEVIASPSRASLARVHATRRTLLALHRVQWRQRDAVSQLQRDEDLPLSRDVRLYLRDVHDHAFQTLDAIESYREMVGGLVDLYLSSASHRMNEVMKTLTIVATVFIPLTFLAGVYGMNFDAMPELHWRWGYPVWWGTMLALAGGLLAWFRGRGWLGGADLPAAGERDEG